MMEQTPMRQKDPVCGMRLEEKEIQATAAYQDKTYIFCSTACKKKFEQSPQRYAGKN